jgi:hypothetical protein
MSKLQILALVPAVLLTAACASQPAADKTASLKEPPSHCLRETGTRLEVPEGKCVAGPGRVVTREQLERSGGITTGAALNRIAPF